MLPDGLNWLCYFAGNSIGHRENSISFIFLESPHQVERTNEFVLFAFLLFTANKSNSSVCFFGESTASQSAFRFYLTFRNLRGYSPVILMHSFFNETKI